MRIHRVLFVSIWLAASVNAANEQPFMSFFNPPAQPIALEEHRSYESAAMKTKVGYNIYLPPGYGDADNTNRYPVIYWLHGRGCSESNDQFPVSTVDAAIRSKTIPPLLFVYASGGGMSFYSDSVDGRWMAETTVIKELIPHIDATYRTIADRGGRAIQGMSMGGFGALKLALKYPDLFSSVVAFAGGFRSAEEMGSNEISREILKRVFGGDPGRFMANHPATIARAYAEEIRDRVAIKLLVGLDDSLLQNNRSMHATLTQVNLAHEYWEIPGIRHDLPRLSAWIGSDGLQFAARHFAAAAAGYGQAQAGTTPSRDAAQPSASDTPKPPNIIIILADDMGWGDLGCYGHPSIRTPNLDRLASQGMRFTDFYSAGEVCTPSRAALLTGRYPIRSGMCDDRYRVLRRVSAGGLPADEITIAQAVKSRGYSTACLGKWHLGNYMNDPAHHPRRHGFDYYFGLPHSNDMNPTPAAPPGATSRLDQEAEWWAAPLFRNEQLIECPADQTTLTRRYTEEAVKFIHEHRDGPFLLYLAHTFPHVPLFASGQFKGRSRRGLYGDVVEEIDWSVGQIVEALGRDMLDRNTFVFFTSDNGPWLTQGEAGGSAGPLREGKGSTWEGGMREPAIAWWPGRIGAGVVTHELACAMDLFTTSLKLAGAAVPADRPIDGVDLAPILFGTGPSQRAAFCYYRGTQLYALRKGPFKAHFTTRSAYGPDAPVAHDPPLLFDLSHDPGERLDVAAGHPEVLADIAKEAERHRAGVTPSKCQLEQTVAE